MRDVSTFTATVRTTAQASLARRGEKGQTTACEHGMVNPPAWKICRYRALTEQHHSHTHGKQQQLCCACSCRASRNDRRRGRTRRDSSRTGWRPARRARASLATGAGDQATDADAVDVFGSGSCGLRRPVSRRGGGKLRLRQSQQRSRSRLWPLMSSSPPPACSQSFGRKGGSGHARLPSPACPVARTMQLLACRLLPVSTSAARGGGHLCVATLVGSL